VRAILTYHSIDDSGSPISVPRSVFAQHVNWLRSGRVRVVSVEELLALPSTADAVAITFDDAFQNFATEAAPRLEGLPVTLFVVTDHVGKTNTWNGRSLAGIPTMPLLDWPTLGRLAERGVTVAAHTCGHPDLTLLAPTALADELARCADRLHKELGAVSHGLAYPYGKFSPFVVAAAARHFRWACTTELRILDDADDVLMLPRLDMFYLQQARLLERWGTPAFLRYLGYRRVLRRGRNLAVATLASIPIRRGCQ
jgi:peptidoglycan/xylan/chitin deacetylase (PgdA/CDA1 family)